MLGLTKSCVVVAALTLLSVGCESIQDSRSRSVIDLLDRAELEPLNPLSPSVAQSWKLAGVIESTHARREAIRMPVPSRLRVPLDVPRDPVFHFSLATVNTDRAAPEGVAFMVSVESDGTRSRVFKEVLADRTLGSWSQRQASLSRWSGKTVTLLLEVLPDSPQGGEQDVSGVVAAWGDPVVSSQSHDVRTEQGVELFNQWNRAGGTGVPDTPAPVGDTKFSHDRGFYEHPFKVTISSSTLAATIVYTVDGSVPSRTHGTIGNSVFIYESTVLRVMAYKRGMRPTNVDTHTYVFPTQVKGQSKHPPRFPERVHSSFLRRRQLVLQWYLNHPDHEESIAAGSSGPLIRPGPWLDLDAEIDPDVVNGGNNREFVEGLLSLPALSLVMNVDDLFDEEKGIYVNHDKRGPEWERAASVELLYPPTGGLSDFRGFQADCGIRMHGSLAGNAARKRSFRLTFKKKYGVGKLRYPFFESAVHHAQSAVDEFDTIILRAGGNANWSKEPASEGEYALYVRDQHARDTQIYLGEVSARGIFVHLYLNGIYWGVYNAIERPDQRFFASYFGGRPLADWYVVNHSGPIARQPASYGRRWQRMHRFARDQDLVDPAHYRVMKTLLDTESFSDYVLQNWFSGMGDWGKNNWYGAIRLNPRGRGVYLCWDSEYTYGLSSSMGNPVAWVDPLFLGAGGSPLHNLWRRLDDSAEFMLEFADRVYRASYNGGPLDDQVNQANFRRLCDRVEKAIFCESARWGDSARGRENYPRTREVDWKRARDLVLDTYMEGNVGRFIAALRAHRYYPSIDPPTITNGDSGILILRPPGAETVYYTVDGGDPRGATASSFTDSKRMIRWQERVKARAKRRGEWSALNEFVAGEGSE